MAISATERRNEHVRWVVGNTAQRLMDRLSKGIVGVGDYPQAVATAHAESHSGLDPITGVIRFSVGPVKFGFQNVRDRTDEGGRNMHLEIQEGESPRIEITLGNRYRRGMGFYDGTVSMVDHNPQAERSPSDTPRTAERILDTLDQYLPIEEAQARQAREVIIKFADLINEPTTS